MYSKEIQTEQIKVNGSPFYTYGLFSQLWGENRQATQIKFLFQCVAKSTTDNMI